MVHGLMIRGVAGDTPEPHGADQGTLEEVQDACCMTSFAPRSMNLGRLAD